MSKELMPIRRGNIEDLAIYEISEDELEKLEKGIGGSYRLNISLFSFGVAISFFVTLWTTNLDDRAFIGFAITVGVSLLLGLFLLISWFTTRSEVSRLVNKIRSRLTPDGDPVPIGEE